MRFIPRKVSEANVQAEFYRVCKEAGITCFLEYLSSWNGTPGCRFDCVIVQNGLIKAIIEVKSRKRVKEPKKMKKYRIFGVPVLLVEGYESIAPTMRTLGKILKR
jgi:ubiquinone/menaquinone biosynthesis C-methylase UbiE